MDWREIQPEGLSARLLMPCKPDRQQRAVQLAGAPVRLQWLACSVGDVSFGFVGGQVGDPARVGPALQALLAGSAANVGVAPSAVAVLPHPVAGATPSPAAGRASISGRHPDGRALRLHTLVFAKGTEVFQVTVLGPQVEAEAVTSYFEGVRATP